MLLCDIAAKNNFYSTPHMFSPLVILLLFCSTLSIISELLKEATEDLLNVFCESWPFVSSWVRLCLWFSEWTWQPPTLRLCLLFFSIVIIFQEKHLLYPHLSCVHWLQLCAKVFIFTNKRATINKQAYS